MGDGDSKRKLYTVTIETEIVVLAIDENAAEEAAEGAMHELSSYDYSIMASPMRYLPGDWDLDALPYEDDNGDGAELSIGDLVKLGAAPKYLVRPVDAPAEVEAAK